ncbi:MerR family transcriptional regulator [Methylomonas sp. SURF-2]|uniref:MerR family transcriptional regulator n=1 Tax=Methylomonas subterranea TaxID=2952225 RepID=A0ABT1TEW7_9GAMM|nr:MerR family transcriptional regulator [Methylomonas sp. SURF-2]MCQ8104005.1 MerR family transcriptional regulator [Methylomonas sp. SURF-2]
MADELGTTPRTIRLYEELGLIAPDRTEGGTRLYARKDLKRMAIALQLGRVGIELESVQKLAQTRQQCTSGSEASAAMQPLLQDLRTRIRGLLEDLEELDRDLERADMLIRQCGNCQNRPNRKDCPDCPVNKNVDLTSIGRLVWDPSCP